MLCQVFKIKGGSQPIQDLCFANPCLAVQHNQRPLQILKKAQNMLTIVLVASNKLTDLEPFMMEESGNRGRTHASSCTVNDKGAFPVR